MTDNEIIKALECCCLDDDCKDCPASNEPSCSDGYVVNLTIDLINRQKAEIEKKDKLIEIADKMVESLKAEVKRLKVRNDELNTLNKTASIEAIKEFAEMYERAIEQLLKSATIEQSYFIYECLNKFKALSYRECTKGCHEIPKESEEMVGDDNA